MLTRKQSDLLDYIVHYLAENGGVSPSFDEMKGAMGLASKSGVHRMLMALEQRGAIRRLHNHARCIEIAGADQKVVPLIPRLEAERVIRAITEAHGERIDEDGITIICSPEELRATVMKALG